MNDSLKAIAAESVFVDTNILFYGVNIGNPDKYAKAGALLEILWNKSILPSISTQILQEFYVTLLKGKIEIDEAQKIVKDYYVWNVIPASTALMDHAFQIQKRYLLSFWDSCLLAAALQAQCSSLLTEDLNHGQKYGKLTAINPFHKAYAE